MLGSATSQLLSQGDHDKRNVGLIVDATDRLELGPDREIGAVMFSTDGSRLVSDDLVDQRIRTGEARLQLGLEAMPESVERCPRAVEPYAAAPAREPLRYVRRPLVRGHAQSS